MAEECRNDAVLQESVRLFGSVNDHGLPLPANRTQQYGGSKWIDWYNDLLSALHYLRKGELTLPGWLRSVRGKKRYAVFS